jgi:hypothetical protein
MKYCDVKNKLGHNFKRNKQQYHCYWRRRLSNKSWAVYYCAECGLFLSDVMEDGIFLTCDEMHIKRIMES